MASPFSFMKIKAILITHTHGDHILGVPGLLQTMSILGRTDHISIYGPEGVSSIINLIMSITNGRVNYPISIIEVHGKEKFNIGKVTVETYSTEHGMPSVGYVIRECDRPGKLDHKKAMEFGLIDGPDLAKIKSGGSVMGIGPKDILGPIIHGLSVSYSGDTLPSKNTVQASKDVDVLIHESTYMNSELSLSRDHNHTTALQAAEIAKMSGVNVLILTHISNRYNDREKLVNEARQIFPNTFIANDMDLYELTKNGMKIRSLN